MKAVKTVCKVEQSFDRFSLKLPTMIRKDVQKVLEYCFEKRGGFVRFEISPPARKRSTGDKSQSHHLNAHIQQIAVETGQPFADVKKYIKVQAISMGYPILEDDNGSPIIDLWGNIQGISETDNTVDDCKLLIDAVHQFADEYQIKLVEE